MQCRCGGGRLDESTDWNSVIRKGKGIEHQLLLGLVVNSISSQSLDYRFPCFAQQESVLSVDIIWMKIQFYCFPNEPVHISRLVGRDLHLLKSDHVITADNIFGHCRFVWLRVMEMPSMFLYSCLNSMARLTNIDLAAFTGNAIHSRCLQSQIILHWSQTAENLLGW